MIWLIIGVVILAAVAIPLFLGFDDKFTHKKCKYCRKKVKIESATCRYCKGYLLEDSEVSS